jgi:hypothetical protein
MLGMSGLQPGRACWKTSVRNIDALSRSRHTTLERRLWGEPYGIHLVIGVS